MSVTFGANMMVDWFGGYSVFLENLIFIMWCTKDYSGKNPRTGEPNPCNLQEIILCFLFYKVILPVNEGRKSNSRQNSIKMEE